MCVEDKSYKEQKLNALGAGIALKLIYLKEKSIKNFKPTKNWGFNTKENWKVDETFFFDNKQALCSIIVSSEVKRTAIVAVRGTNSLKDFKIDIEIAKIKNPYGIKGKAPDGWEKKTEQIINESNIKNITEKFVKNHYRVLFIGHSSGGAVSSILSASLFKILTLKK